jgi:DNA-binding transcriptional MerR regulator
LRKDGLYQIGEVAERTGLSIRTIRYYEETGLAVPSGRTRGGFRLYTDEDTHRLEIIKHLKILDLPLEDTKDVLDALDLLRSGNVEHQQQERLLKQVAGFVAEAQNRSRLLSARLEASRQAIVELRQVLLGQRYARLGRSG